MQTRAFLVAVATLALPLAAQTAAVGDAVSDFSFPKLVNGDGRQKISEFFGQPVMLEFWGTR